MLSISIVFYNILFMIILNLLNQLFLGKNLIKKKFLSGNSKQVFGGIVDYLLKYTIKKGVINAIILSSSNHRILFP